MGSVRSYLRSVLEGQLQVELHNHMKGRCCSRRVVPALLAARGQALTFAVALTAKAKRALKASPSPGAYGEDRADFHAWPGTEAHPEPVVLHA